MLHGAGLVLHRHEDLTVSVLRTWELVHRRVRKLRPLARFASAPIREFSTAVDIIGEAFRSRLLAYQVCVAVRG